MPEKPTHGTFDDILDLAGPPLRPICASLRKLVASHHADFVEVVWPSLKIASFGVGPRKNTQHYAYIAVQPQHINLGFYQGASLSDPSRLLEGSGKNLRHVKIHDIQGAERPALGDLLRQAIAERMPYR